MNRSATSPGSSRAFITEAMRYGVASAIALAADMSLLWLLVNVTGMHYLAAAALAFAAGATVAYLLSVRFVFRFRRVSRSSVEFASFLALGVAGLLVNEAALFVAISAAGLGLVTAKVLAAGCTFATNFTLRRRLLFAAPKAP